MTDAERLALEIAAGATAHPRDNALNAWLIRGARPADRAATLRLIAAKRAAHLDWLTVTQRKWQKGSRRESALRRKGTRQGFVQASERLAYSPLDRFVAECMTTRERYVRCAQ